MLEVFGLGGPLGNRWSLVIKGFGWGNHHQHVVALLSAAAILGAMANAAPAMAAINAEGYPCQRHRLKGHCASPKEMWHARLRSHELADLARVPARRAPRRAPDLGRGAADRGDDAGGDRRRLLVQLHGAACRWLAH